MSKIEISVIISVYNHEKYIARCIRSLISQSFNLSNFEIIVVNDGSNDNTSKILEAFSEDIIIINNDINLGLPTSLNIGIKKAKGRYIVRVDSDDYVNTDFLKILYLNVSSNREFFDAYACDYVEVDEEENVLKRCDCQIHPIACGIIFNINHIIDIGLYNENFFIDEEIEMRKRFEKKYKIGRVQLPLYRYRKHETNMTNFRK